MRTNLILSDSVEREYSSEGVEMVPLGLYMIKGDNVYVQSTLLTCPRCSPSKAISIDPILLCPGLSTLFLPSSSLDPSSPFTDTFSAIVAEIDEEKDSTIDYAEIKAEPISEIRH